MAGAALRFRRRSALSDVGERSRLAETLVRRYTAPEGGVFLECRLLCPVCRPSRRIEASSSTPVESQCSSGVEQVIRNDQVAGSIPAIGSTGGLLALL